MMMGHQEIVALFRQHELKNELKRVRDGGSQLDQAQEENERKRFKK